MKSKSDAPLEAIQTGAAYKPLRKPQWWGGSPVVAFDFETIDGEPFMLAIDDGLNPDHAAYTVEAEAGDGSLIDSERILRTLASQRWAANCTCVWFNLGFDAEIFARSLPRRAAQELNISGHTEYETKNGKEVSITYIKGKLLRFSDEFGHSVTHYDIGNIVRGSLDSTSEEWLGERKGDDVDASRFAEPGYVAENLGDIRRYARRDVELTRRLSEAVLAKAEEAGIPAGRPVSTGYLAAEFVRERLDRKVGWGPNWVQSMAWDAFAGGRFEVFERGDVGRVAGPDINSAYPAIMATLPDPGSLAWEKARHPTLSDVRAADWGVVRATVTTDASRRIQPFATKPDGVVVYPAFTETEVTVLLPTFLHAVDVGLVTSFDIETAALGYETDATYRPFDFFEGLYAERKALEGDGRMKAGLMLKIVMNSVFGKTAQTTLKKSILGESVDVNEAASEPWETFSAPGGIPTLVSQEAGSLFNPFIASHITGLTRLKLHRAVLEAGLEADTVLFATDCIMVREGAYDASDFSDLLGDELGEWDFDYRGKAFVVGSGVYEVNRTDLSPDDFDTFSALRSKSRKMATRGFREAQLSGLRMAADEFRDAPDGIPLESTRPVTLGEAFAQGGPWDIGDVGRFRTTERGLTAGFDSKRDWSRDVETFGDLLGDSHGSRPLHLSD